MARDAIPSIPFAGKRPSAGMRVEPACGLVKIWICRGWMASGEVFVGALIVELLSDEGSLTVLSGAITKGFTSCSAGLSCIRLDLQLELSFETTADWFDLREVPSRLFRE